MGKAGHILGRILAVVFGIVLLAIFLRLIGAILDPILPDPLARDMLAGFNLLYSIVSPAMPAIFALGILAAVIWVFIARRGR